MRDEVMDNIYQEAINAFGKHTQLILAMEECAELIQAISHHIRGRKHGASIVEEIADVEIMIGELKCVVSPIEIDIIKNLKLQRLEKRIMEATVKGQDNAS